ncbi:MAG TPA: prepilin-type N-terminal cleavage/methylation domain-containing protein, partial [Pseudobdellovibrionaceae bacterium]|nr:prepilin-type N-terminal cleavage/methylation domain-containing protein [Pseudobdellovibrionaceae bacterium]
MSFTLTSKKFGFTLLEVMITLVILSAMILLISRSLQQTITFKKTLQMQLDDTSRLQDVIRVLEKDLQLAFHYTDYFKTIDELIKKKNQAAAQKAQTPQNPQTAPPTTPTPTEPEVPEIVEAKPVDGETHFIGDEKTMSFVTMNNASFFSSEPQADFVTVGYSVKTCRSLNEGAA